MASESAASVHAAVAANCNAGFLVGVLLNALLTYLILRYSSAELQVYARVLLQTVVVNTSFLLMEVLFMPVEVAGVSGTVLYGVGWATRENDGTSAARTWNFLLSMVSMYALYFSQFSVIAPFIFRYCALCRGWVLSGGAYAAVLGVSGIASTFFVWEILLEGVRRSWIDWPAGNTKLQFQMNTAEPTRALLAEQPELLLDDPTTPNATMSTRMAIAWVVLPVADGGPGAVDSRPYTCIAVIVYAVVVACSVAVYRHLRSAFRLAREAGVAAGGSGSKGGGVAQKQRSVNGILAVQAAVPLIVDFIPTCAGSLLIMLFPGLTPNQLLRLILGFLTWAPALNALSVMLVVSPYRRALFRGLKKVLRAGGGESTPVAAAIVATSSSRHRTI